MSFDTDCMRYPTDMERNQYYMMMEQSYSPEFTAFPRESPTYSVSSHSSASVMGSMQPCIEEDYLTVKSEPDSCGPFLSYSSGLDSIGTPTRSCSRDSLSPLPESPYDAYSHHFTTGQPLLTPPASEDLSLGLKSRQPIEPYMSFYPSDPFRYSSPFDNNNNNTMHPLCCSSPPLPPPCYSHNCYCNMPMPSVMCHGNSNTIPSSYSSSTMSSSPYYHPTKLPARVPKQKQHQEKSMANAPRRYKCTLCDKRFTRPSSLATHMHSHTGEKPYKCQVDGCGRRFSVVSNLRRHAKVHTHIA